MKYHLFYNFRGDLIHVSFETKEELKKHMNEWKNNYRQYHIVHGGEYYPHIAGV